MNGTVTEQFLIHALVRGLTRCPLQRNTLHSSDAEIVALPGQEGAALAVTTDAIVEEIQSGLYTDPGLAGWMAVMANMSDLAAVGAEPLGMLLAQTLPRDIAEEDIAMLDGGIRKALETCSTYLLGGDTNIADRLMLTGTALGLVSLVHPLCRVGCCPGDVLYASGPLGGGNAYAASLFSGARALHYRPTARLHEGRTLPGIASACMDTSDGVLATLDQLVRLNGVGFALREEWEDTLSRDAYAASQRLSLPAWLLLAGCHGEFELLFTVPPERERELHLAAASIDWHPLHLGAVTAHCGVTIPLDGTAVALDTGKIRGLWDEMQGDIRSYLRGLMDIDASLRQCHCVKERAAF